MAVPEINVKLPGQEERDQDNGPEANLPPNGQTEWVTVWRPMAQFIVYLGTGFLLFLFREAIFGGKPQANWTYIILMLIQLLVLTSVCHSVTALFFSTNMTIKERCHEVRLSLTWLMIIIILAVISSIVLMAKAYRASLA